MVNQPDLGDEMIVVQLRNFYLVPIEDEEDNHEVDDTR